jgi:hypothetical protein
MIRPPRNRRTRIPNREDVATRAFLAAQFPAKPPLPPSPLSDRVTSLCEDDRVDEAWKLCVREGEAPERFGLYRDIVGEEWESIQHYINATGVMYDLPFQWQCPGWLPSACIVFTFIAMALNYRRSAIDDIFTVAAGPFDDGYLGTRQRNEHTCFLNACHWRRLVIEEARRRYREGFYADPFAAEPMRRPPPGAPH